MQVNNETLRILVSGVVWITAIVIFGRLGMFIAINYFKKQTPEHIHENQTPERVREKQYIGKPVP